jgi:hypothetical protein
MSVAIIRKLFCPAAILALMMAANDAAARKSSVSLESLTRYSAAIAVARVESVGSVRGVRVAQAIVLHPLKGLRANQRFAFLAEGTWRCDESDAVVGETVLLVLEAPGPVFHHFIKAHPRFVQERNRRLGSMPFYQIAHSGSGRMPVCRMNGADYLPAKNGFTAERPMPVPQKGTRLPVAQKRPRTVPWIGLVQLPINMKMSAFPRADGKMIWYVSLLDVMNAIRKHGKPPKYASRRDPRLI